MLLLLCNDNVGEWWWGWCGWNGERPNGFVGPCRNEGGGGGGKNPTELAGGEKSKPLLKGCGDNREGDVDIVSFVFDFIVLLVNEDKNEGVTEDDKDFDGDGVWIIEL